jgi:transcriptional regulator with XRE-family HTH domain
VPPPQADGVVGLPQPTRIRAARYLRGLTQPDVVRQMVRPITAPALSQIEAGRVNPTRRTIDDLAGVLAVPVGFFYAQWPDTAFAQSAAPATFFRDLASTPARERRRASALAMIVSDLVAAIEERLRLPEVRLPHYELPVDASDEEVEAAAEALRDEWTLGTERGPGD